MAGHGPGVSWLAARTGRNPEQLAGSPAAVADALREALALAARSASPDPEVRARARAEAGALQEQFAAAPPEEAFAATIAVALRDAADRLRRTARSARTPQGRPEA
ncbi:hypothetical protein [Actinoplanes flavus]|uniref:Uncharacterized protein n=1 Tax=Actinoplanes flavus TaxID=2820290 RepID=A0ABS3UT97_9ACTN|nr:hypothetical protein [Actinoplanes flavus]MBO3741800.1 hypothetical protein [Actinoplanes flavus]